MVDMPDSPASPVPPIQGPALAHARGFSMLMGGLSGTIAGALFGAVWGMASGTSIKVRSITLAGLGALAGTGLSARTWQSPGRTAAPAPVIEPAFPALPASESSTKHTERLTAERAVQADTAQAL